MKSLLNKKNDFMISIKYFFKPVSSRTQPSGALRTVTDPPEFLGCFMLQIFLHTFISTQSGACFGVVGGNQSKSMRIREEHAGKTSCCKATLLNY